MLLLQIAHKYTAAGLHTSLHTHMYVHVCICVCVIIVATTMYCMAVALALLHDSCLLAGHLARRLKTVTALFVISCYCCCCRLYVIFRFHFIYCCILFQLLSSSLLLLPLWLSQKAVLDFLLLFVHIAISLHAHNVV